MPRKYTPIPSLAADLFRYEEGKLFWKVDRNGGVDAGTRAGYVSASGYRNVKIAQRSFREHRVIWFLCTGDDPGLLEIDHINHDRTDNRIENLRVVTHRENVQHRLLPTATGFPGVGFTRAGRYNASISINEITVSLGEYDKGEDAYAAYVEAKLRFHPGFIADTSLPIGDSSKRRKRANKGYGYYPSMRKDLPWVVRVKIGGTTFKSFHASELEAQIEVARLRSGHPAVMSR
jgi:hypothetical protein